MARFDVFVSAVLVVRDAQQHIADDLRQVHAMLVDTAAERELVVIDNGSTDGTFTAAQAVAEELADIQITCLSRAVDRDAATFAGIEHALGDYVVVLEPTDAQIAFLPTLLEAAIAGHDLVFAEPRGGLPRPGVLDGVLAGLYRRAFRWSTGLDLQGELLHTRLLTRQVINFLMQHENAPLMLPTLPSVAGYPKTVLTYDESADAPPVRRDLAAQAVRGVGMLLTVTALPARLTTVVSLLAGFLNVLYAGYVVAIYLFKDDVAEGWTTLSLQISGMFFLFSIVLALLSEYVIRIFQGGLGRPAYHVAREVRSPALSREARLNVLRGDTTGSVTDPGSAPPTP